MTITGIRRLAKKHNCLIEMLALSNGAVSIRIHKNGIMVAERMLSSAYIETAPFDVVNVTVKSMCECIS